MLYFYLQLYCLACSAEKPDPVGSSHSLGANLFPGIQFFTEICLLNVLKHNLVDKYAHLLYSLDTGETFKDLFCICA